MIFPWALMKVTHRLFDTEAAKVKREARMLRTLMKKLKEHFAPYLESALPRAFEKACERTRRRFRRAYIYIYISSTRERPLRSSRTRAWSWTAP